MLYDTYYEHGTGMILLTDITYLFYNHGDKAYLSVIQDACTKEVMAYVASKSLEVDFVLDTINILIHDHGISLSSELFFILTKASIIQVFHSASLLKDNELRQSISRRGNGWNNAPQELFFGMKSIWIDVTVL